MNPFYQGARFLTAATRIEQAPEDRGREVVFAGRSNAGKSSAINALCHQKALARTSKTPGRTQQLIFFALDAERRLVDLPGYGYARVSESIKLQWQAQMADFLRRRRCLAGLVIVMDIRHPLTDYDRQMLAWGQGRGIPVLLLLTKADKLKWGAIRSAQRAVELEARRQTGADFPPIVLPFSAHEGSGVAPVQALLDQWLAVAPRP
jgi:GTP-binding protein